ncbi:LysR family transcriptional regulator [Aliidiomarina halalkaliphila]|nr:LysR family transcriptional regulator [Aliidiomarina halalkaliphila]
MKNNNFPSLNALRVFEAVSRLGSFKAAAAELAVTQSAISRQITALEEQLGIRLIQRDNRVHALTPAGDALAPELSRVFRQIERLVKRTMKNGEHARRTLTLGISSELLRWWLGPVLDEFNQLYPHLELHCVQVPEYLSRQNEAALSHELLHGELDALLTFSAPAQKAISNWKLTDTNLILVRPEKLPAPTEESLPNYKYVAVNTNKDWDRWVRVHDTKVAAEHIQLVNNTSMAVELAQYTGRLMLLPDCYQRAATQSGLVHVEGFDLNGRQGLHLSVRRESQKEMAIVALVNWMRHVAESQKK